MTSKPQKIRCLLDWNYWNLLDVYIYILYIYFYVTLKKQELLLLIFHVKKIPHMFNKLRRWWSGLGNACTCLIWDAFVYPFKWVKIFADYCFETFSPVTQHPLLKKPNYPTKTNIYCLPPILIQQKKKTKKMSHFRQTICKRLINVENLIRKIDLNNIVIIMMMIIMIKRYKYALFFSSEP